MSDQITHGAILDIIEQSTEFTFQAVDYLNYEAGKPFKSGQLSLPETANNRAALSSLYDTDGANKVRIIENVLYENDTISIEGSLIITGQSYANRINTLSAFFVSGNALMWLDFGDTKLTELDWSIGSHVLNYTNVMGSETTPIGGLIVYDLCDRGKFIDGDTVDLIERYPAFNLAKMLQVIFTGYDLITNFITESWFSAIYLMFTQTNEIRNTEEWKEAELISGSGDLDLTDNTIYMYGPLVDWDRADDYFQTTFIGTGEFDTGLNWDATNKWYLVPETGTYRFKLTVDGDAYLRTETSAVPTGLITYAQFTISLKINNTTVLARVYIDDADGSENSEMIFNNYVIDSDYYELQAGDKISIHTYYNVRIAPTVQSVYWTYTSAINFTLTNQVSRYYGYGSTVNPALIMPDLKVNDFLKMVFFHYGITPQYSIATNIVRLDVFEKTQTGTDINTLIDPLTGAIDYLEAFDFEVNFADDSADKFALDYYKRNPLETGNYKASNGNKVKKLFQSDFSNTILQAAYRLDADVVKIPVMWSEIPEGNNYTTTTVPDWKTTFNLRLLKLSGVESTNAYKFGYHVAGAGRTVTDEQFIVFTPFDGVEFADRLGIEGLYNRLHRYLINRINNGSILTIQGKSDVNYLINLVNSDTTENINTPVYISAEPYNGTYTIQKIVTDGVISQFTLILNDE